MTALHMIAADRSVTRYDVSAPSVVVGPDRIRCASLCVGV